MIFILFSISLKILLEQIYNFYDNLLKFVFYYYFSWLPKTNNISILGIKNKLHNLFT